MTSGIDVRPTDFKQQCYYENECWQGGYACGLTVCVTCLTFGIVLAGSYFASFLNYLASGPSFFYMRL